MTERAPPPSARLPATAPASSVPGAGQRSRNTRDKPAVFYSESSERRRAPESPCQTLFSRRSPPEDLRKITPSAGEAPPDAIVPRACCLTLHKKVERIIQCKRHDGKSPSAERPIARHRPASSVPGAKRRSRNTVTNRPSYILSPPKGAALPERPCQTLFSRRSPPEDLRKITPSTDEAPSDAIVPRACCFRDAPELHEKARGADHIDPLRAPVQLRLFKSSSVKYAITSRPSRRPSASAPRRRWCRRHWPSACRRTLRPVP